MNNGEMNVAIAKAIGWTKIEWYDGDNSGPAYWCGIPPARIIANANSDWEAHIDKYSSPLPDYVTDLNACHEMEKTLDDGVLWKGYLNRLWEVVCPQFEQMGGLNAAIGLLLVHATAYQRCQAF